MSYTKGELVNAALEEIGLASYEFDISSESSESALTRLDSMMMEWNGRGILLSYPIGNPGTTSLDEDSNVPFSAVEAVVTNLAIRIAPSYGKNVSLDTKVTAKKALNTVLIGSTKPRQRQFQNMPSGAGYKCKNSFIRPEKDTYLEDVDEQVDLGGQ